MSIGIYRRKLLNAVLFFAKNTKRVNVTKLSKLLYFLDFTHFRQTGYPSIGLRYYAFQKGPVPKGFWLEIKDGHVPEDFRQKIALLPQNEDLTPGYKETLFRAIANPDMSVFSPRELKILENLTFVFKDATARDMSEVSHLPNQPWDKTTKTCGVNCPIDYLLGIDEKATVGLEEARESLREHFEAVHNLGLEPTDEFAAEA